MVRFPRSGRPRHPGGVTRVFSSDDGSAWSSEAVVSEEGVDLRDSKLTITPDGRLMLLMGGSVYDEKGKSPTRARLEPATVPRIVLRRAVDDDRWAQLHPPPDGRLRATGRVPSELNGPTVLTAMTTTFEPVLTLPCGGDSSYVGMVWYDDLLWMSYYSSQDSTNIYMAKVRL